MPAPKELRFGVIGLGLMGREFASVIGRWHHLLDMPVKPRLAAVCDSNPALHAWFLDSLPGPIKAYTDYRELLKDPSVDAVYCAVPHHLHEALYIDIIKAGKHLLGEKPFGIDQAANARILEAAKLRPDLCIRCSSEFPYFPGAQKLIQAAMEQRFGRILEVNAGFLHSSDMDFNKPLNWKRQVGTNGEYGCMGDLGMHVLHIPLRLGWFPSRLFASLSKVVDQRPDGKGGMAPCGTWDNAQLLCQVESDGQSFPMNLKTQRMAPGETDTWFIEVKGTRHSAAFSTKFPKSYWSMDYENGGEQAWMRADLGYTPAHKTITGHIFEFGFTDAMLQMWASFCVEAAGFAPGPFPCVSLEETRQSHAILTAALESQKLKNAVAPKA